MYIEASCTPTRSPRQIDENPLHKSAFKQNTRSRNNFTLDIPVPDLGYLIEVVIIIMIIIRLIAMAIVIVIVGSGRVRRPIKFSQTAAELRMIRELT